MSDLLHHPEHQVSVDVLVDRAWEMFQGLRGHPNLVEPAIPILYFGDLGTYVRSPRRILTVGLNPSGREFPTNDPFERFPAAPRLAPHGYCNTERGAYRKALDRYFATKPYRAWFGAFEPILNGLDASFYAGRASTALHTDICSPLATVPTWAGLSPAVRATLSATGTPLWFDLVQALEPDVVLVSVGKTARSPIDARLSGPWTSLHKVARANPYEVVSAPLPLASGRRTLVVFGQAAQTPFGLVSRMDKEAIGRAIAERFDER